MCCIKPPIYTCVVFIKMVVVFEYVLAVVFMYVLAVVFEYVLVVMFVSLVCCVYWFVGWYLWVI